MDTDLPIIAITDAADKKNCHRTTIHRAIERGDLSATEFGGRRAVIRDEAWKNWTPDARKRRGTKENQ